MDALTRTEVGELAQHERTIERGLGTFRDVGAALLSIRDSKLYRNEHKTFEAYCQERWKLKRQRAYELIDAAAVAGDVGNFRHAPKESHAVKLAAVPKESRAEVWEQVVDKAPKVNGEPKITATLVKEVVDEWAGEDEVEEESPMFDYLDQPVPEGIRGAFDDEHFIDDAIGQLKAAFKSAEAVAESAAGKFLNLKQFRALLKDAKALLEATRPFAICPYCHGRKCSACAQVGVVPKEVLEQAQKGS